jgi:hypothetical protein
LLPEKVVVTPLNKEQLEKQLASIRRSRNFLKLRGTPKAVGTFIQSKDWTERLDNILFNGNNPADAQWTIRIQAPKLEKVHRL